MAYKFSGIEINELQGLVNSIEAGESKPDGSAYGWDDTE